jgi:hypothetical protein
MGYAARISTVKETAWQKRAKSHVGGPFPSPSGRFKPVLARTSAMISGVIALAPFDLA